jgi:S1-C subfamily serine protease
VALNDQVIKNGQELYSVLAEFQTGDSVTLTILREDKEQKVQVKLAASQ